MFVDSHCHFDFPAFDADRPDVWARAREKGVTAMLVPGVSPDQWSKPLAFSQSLFGVYFTVGLHPWWLAPYLEKITAAPLQFFDQLSEKIHAYCLQRTFVAIGECGLDKSIDIPLALQIDALKRQIEWCNTFKLPIVLHCHKAHAELLALLKKTPVHHGGVVHAFSGSMEIAFEYIQQGLCLGAGGVITYERASKTRNTFRQVPLSAILLETDAPDMPPCGYQGQRNSPERVPIIAKTLAGLRGESVVDIAACTTANFERGFLNAKQAR